MKRKTYHKTVEEIAKEIQDENIRIVYPIDDIDAILDEVLSGMDASPFHNEDGTKKKKKKKVRVYVNPYKQNKFFD